MSWYQLQTWHRLKSEKENKNRYNMKVGCYIVSAENRSCLGRPAWAECFPLIYQLFPKVLKKPRQSYGTGKIAITWKRKARFFLSRSLCLHSHNKGGSTTPGSRSFPLGVWQEEQAPSAAFACFVPQLSPPPCLSHPIPLIFVTLWKVLYLWSPLAPKI